MSESADLGAGYPSGRAKGVLGVLTGITDYLAGLVLLVLAAGVTVSVFFRASGITWTGVFELAAISLVVMTMLTIASLTYRDAHVKVDLVDEIGSRRLGRAFELVASVIQIMVSATVLYATTHMLASDISQGTTFGGDLGLPRAWPGTVLPVSFALVLLVLVIFLVRHIGTLFSATKKG